MTIRVKITHDQPGYDKAIAVQFRDQKGGHNVSPQVIIHPGETKELYVWKEQTLLILEGPTVGEGDKNDSASISG